ncbi:hypothetical protein H072_916 [Dactylellina haptotyla CBS 200.50]|uniref:Mid2 domain-containing protein n=1 Tax=Dactylellina haptotyla (strain CBS 200.50) TaxID=1284197 RepID=S8CBP0_DACHA|nr:hypothetical protein H072_916 [Dactylellina haptotyla CBS 200.50]
MRFGILSSLVSLVAIVAPFVGAQGVENNENPVSKPAADEVWTAGNPFSIEWAPSANAGTVSIVLVKGAPGALEVLETIAPGIVNSGKFEWTPPVSLEGMQTMGAQIYEIKIVNDLTGNFGFSPQFKIDSPASTFNGGAAASSVSSAAPATTDTATAASTTSVSSVSTDITSASVTSSETVISSSTVLSSTESVTSASASTETSASPTSAPTTLATSVSSSSATETSASATSSPADSTAASETSSQSPTSTADASAPVASKPKLGGAAIAGITGGIIGAVIIGILAVFLFRRRKQQSRSKLVGGTTAAPSKYDRDFQMMERRARHRPTSSFGFNTTRSDTSGNVGDRNDPYVPLGDADSLRHHSGTWNGSRF